MQKSLTVLKFYYICACGMKRGFMRELQNVRIASWMAPETVHSSLYDNEEDLWSVGILASARSRFPGCFAWNKHTWWASLVPMLNIRSFEYQPCVRWSMRALLVVVWQRIDVGVWVHIFIECWFCLMVSHDQHKLMRMALDEDQVIRFES